MTTRIKKYHFGVLVRLRYIHQDKEIEICKLVKIFPHFTDERHTLLNTLSNSNYSFLMNTSQVLTQTLLFGNISLSLSHNFKIFDSTIDLILSWNYNTNKNNM